MNAGGTRIIYSQSNTVRREVKELLVSVCTAELVVPSKEIWLTSPWLSDVPLLDNRAGAFRGLGSGWARQEVTLFRVLAELVRRRSRLVITTRPFNNWEKYKRRLADFVGEGPAKGRLFWLEPREELHTKGLIGDGYVISGSMNFTYNGINILDEGLIYETRRAQVAEHRVNFETHYPVPD